MQMKKKRIAVRLCLAAAGCLLLAAAAGAQEQEPATFNPAQQQIRNSIDLMLNMNPAPMQPGSYPMASAMSDAVGKLDPAVQASINEKLMKIMQQTIQETLSDTRFMQEMQQRFSIMPSPAVKPAPAAAPPPPAPVPPSVEPLENSGGDKEQKQP
ncbi:hypothetical protein GCAAIG_14040 [Candidatus Electronema halotolerans]